MALSFDGTFLESSRAFLYNLTNLLQDILVNDCGDMIVSQFFRILIEL